LGGFNASEKLSYFAVYSAGGLDLNAVGTMLVDADLLDIDVGAGGFSVDAGSGINFRTTNTSSVVLSTNSTQRFSINGAGGVVFGSAGITSGSVLADFQSTSLGILLPRVTNTAAITTPVNGMIAYDAATNEFIFRQNGSWTGLGSGSGIGGSTGSVDNALLRANGTGGSTVQSSDVVISDNADITLGTPSLAAASNYRTISADSDLSFAFLRMQIKGGDTRIELETGEWAIITQGIALRSDGFGLAWSKIDATTSANSIAGAPGETGSTQGLDLYIRGGSGISGSRGGHLGLSGGNNNLGEYSNVGIGAEAEISSLDWQDMERGIYIKEATAAPTDAPVEGSFLYGINGELNIWN